ncbi:GNAT family N-acetyltransferase [Bacillus salacetis]|uniref:GNAT family N-acetyltransferase n=1 Tax=Bacillus salacetis TaxID=2315464 RepID=A0A3A1QVN6_9BACI|nr:GNAT family N-acetyltransferase [Bacillus salacetis]
MIYYKEGDLRIRPAVESDGEKLVEGFKEQGWEKPLELFRTYHLQQSRAEIDFFVAECGQIVAGYVVLIPETPAGPFAAAKIPEIVDLNVLKSFQNHGVGSKLMDAAERKAEEMSDSVSLAAGLHFGYGTAQRMYVKRGYIPDGSGVWYRGRQLEQYGSCVNDDDLVLYLRKYFK